MLITLQLVGEKGLSEVDAGEGAKLIEVVLHNCRGKIDERLDHILTLAVRRLFHPDTTRNSLRVLLLEVVSNSLYYNPALALHILDRAGCIQPLFETWFQNVAH